MFHDVLTKLAFKYFKLSKKGVCRGATLRWIEASHLQETAKYDERLNYLVNNQTTNEQFFSSGEFPLIEEQQDLLLFYNSLVLFQAPTKFSEIFIDSYSNENIDQVSKFASSKKIEELGGLVFIGSNLRLFQREGLANYLKEMAKIFENIKPLLQGPLTFNLSTYNHDMGLSYEVGKGWKFMDINQYSSKCLNIIDETEIANKIFDLYDKQNTSYLALDFTLLSPKSASYQSILRRELDKLQKSYVFTADKIKEPAALALFILALRSPSYNELVKNLINYGINIEDADILANKDAEPDEIYHLIWRAYSIKNYAAASLLVAANAELFDEKISASGLDLFYLATQDGQLEILKTLVARGVKDRFSYFYKNNYSPLFVATQFEHIKVVKYLIENGAEVNQKSQSGRTALQIACVKGNVEMVKYLLDKGAKENLNQMMSLAIQGAHLALIKLLSTYSLSLNTSYIIPIESLKKFPNNKSAEEKLANFLKANKSLDPKMAKISLTELALIIDDKELWKYSKGIKAPNVVTKKDNPATVKQNVKLKPPEVVFPPEKTQDVNPSLEKLPHFFKSTTYTQAAILKLEHYKNKRKLEGWFHYNIFWLTTISYFIQDLLFSNHNTDSKNRKIKISATTKLLSMLNGEVYADFTKFEILACKDGRLGQILKQHKINVAELSQHPELEKSVDLSF